VSRPYPLPAGVIEAERAAANATQHAPVTIVATSHPQHGWHGQIVDTPDGPALHAQLADMLTDQPGRTLTELLDQTGQTVLQPDTTPADTTATARRARWLILADHWTLTLHKIAPGPLGVRTTTRITDRHH